MRTPTEIQKLEREALVEYIRKLHASLPVNESHTLLNRMKTDVVWERIKSAEEELALL
jgi:hypothetical protein